MRALAYVIVAALTALALSACTADAGSSGPTIPPRTASAPAGTGAEVFTPIVASVLTPPSIVPSTDGSGHLAYELLLTNVLSQPVAIDAVAVQGDSGAELLRLGSDQLAPWMRPMGAAGPGRMLAAGQRATVTLDVVLPPSHDAPKELIHLITLSPEHAMAPLVQATMTEKVAATAVSAAAPVVISSPVRGPNWLDGNSCCEMTPHREALNPINGTLYAPERFAIDFVQLDSQGRIFHGPVDDLSSYAFYGADILAVADGPIVSMGWDLPEEPPGANPTGLKLDEYGGNHIVQDIGHGRYAFYAHLQGGNPEALVQGQQLTRGQVIGHLGNSGNTDMPHLHFHVMDSPRPLASNGLPFLIDSFDLVGAVPANGLSDCMASPVSCRVDTRHSAATTKRGLLYRDVISVRG